MGFIEGVAFGMGFIVGIGIMISGGLLISFLLAWLVEQAYL